MKLLKTLSLAIMISIITGSLPHLVKAQANKSESKNFGIGLMLGEPTGVSIKHWIGHKLAFDIGAAWSLADRNEALHLHSDFLLHSWFKDQENLAFYYGIGARIIFADEAAAGIRVPLGLNYVFHNIPFDLFVEAVPIVDFTPDTGFAGNGAVGIRYYF